MKRLHLPFVDLPIEFVTLLKSNLSVTTSSDPIFNSLRKNRAIISVLETSFKEFDDGRGIEKVMLALGWSNFRERMASVYISKIIFGDYPLKTNMELVEDIKEFESQYSDHSVHSYSRAFLLGFYLKMANIEIQRRENNQFLDLKIPPEIITLLKLSQGRSERIDWLILILWHVYQSVGEKMLVNNIALGKKFEGLYHIMPADARENMHQNLLAYGASIREADIFLYEKI